MESSVIPKLDEIMNCGKRVLHFTVDGEPVPQGRPRFSVRGGRAIARDPERSREYKEKVKAIAEEAVYKANWTMAHVEMPVRVTMHIYKPIREGTARWKKYASHYGLIAPTVHSGDIENISKGILDAINELVYKDDCQIYSLHCEARFSHTPRVEVYVEAIYTNVSDIKAKYKELQLKEKANGNSDMDDV